MVRRSDGSVLSDAAEEAGVSDGGFFEAGALIGVLTTQPLDLSLIHTPSPRD